MGAKICGVFWFQFVVLHFTHNSVSVPVPFTSLRDGHIDNDEAQRGVRGLFVVTRLGKLPVEHWDTRLLAIRSVVISQQEQFVSDF